MSASDEPNGDEEYEAGLALLARCRRRLPTAPLPGQIRSSGPTGPIGPTATNNPEAVPAQPPVVQTIHQTSGERPSHDDEGTTAQGWTFHPPFRAPAVRSWLKAAGITIVVLFLLLPTFLSRPSGASAESTWQGRPRSAPNSTPSPSPVDELQGHVVDSIKHFSDHPLDAPGSKAWRPSRDKFLLTLQTINNNLTGIGIVRSRVDRHMSSAISGVTKLPLSRSSCEEVVDILENVRAVANQAEIARNIISATLNSLNGMVAALIDQQATLTQDEQDAIKRYTDARRPWRGDFLFRSTNEKEMRICAARVAWLAVLEQSNAQWQRAGPITLRITAQYESLARQATNMCEAAEAGASACESGGSSLPAAAAQDVRDLIINSANGEGRDFGGIGHFIEEKRAYAGNQ